MVVSATCFLSRDCVVEYLAIVYVDAALLVDVVGAGGAVVVSRGDCRDGIDDWACGDDGERGRTCH